MDKYEYRLKTEQMLKLVDKKDYINAMKIADTIDWRRVKSVSMLCTVSDIYEKNENYEEARDILLIAYGRSPIGRMILYRLAELAIKMYDFEEAQECYEEFVQVAPKDSSQYILQYKISKGQGASLEKQIEVLEKYKQIDFREKWAYELARLYHKAGMTDKCVEACDDLILWFSEGKYVIKAMELKMKYKPLSPMQQKKYDQRHDEKLVEKLLTEETEETEQKVEVLPSESFDEPEKNTEPESAVHEDDDGMESTAEIERLLKGLKVELEDVDENELKEDKPTGFFSRLFGRDKAVSEEDTEEMSEEENSVLQKPVQEEPDQQETAPAELTQSKEMDIEPVNVNVGPFDTMNLQKELAQNMAKLFEATGDEAFRPKEITKEIPDVKENQKTLEQQTEEFLAEIRQKIEKETAKEEPKPAKRNEQLEQLLQEIEEKPLEVTQNLNRAEQLAAQVVNRAKEQTQQNVQVPVEEIASQMPVQTIETSSEQVPELNRQVPEQNFPAQVQEPQVIPASRTQEAPMRQPEKNGDIFRNKLTVDDDGQVSLFIPEETALDKQITGQLTIGEILDEWEKTKKAAEEAIAEGEKRKHEERVKKQQTAELDYLRRQDTASKVPDDIQQLMNELEAEHYKKAQPNAYNDINQDRFTKEVNAAENIQRTPEPVRAAEPQTTKEPEWRMEPQDTKEPVRAAEPQRTPEPVKVPEPQITKEPEWKYEPQYTYEPEAAEALQATPKFEWEEETQSKEVKNTRDLSWEEPQSTAEAPVQQMDAAPQSTKDNKISELSDAQKSLFSYFVPVRGMSEQIVQVLEDDRKCKGRNGTSVTGNILIVGRQGTGKTMLALNLVKAIQRARRMRTGKVAKISADSLNRKDVKGIVEKLAGGSLIIENAGRLSDDTVRNLNQVMNEYTGELLVIMEDERSDADRLLSRFPEFADKFSSRIEIPIFINDELVSFGKVYARESGYMIDDMGILALYTRIDEQQREDHAVTVAEVKDIIDEAIEHAAKGSVKKFVNVFKKKQEETEVVLREQDFGL